MFKFSLCGYLISKLIFQLKSLQNNILLCFASNQQLLKFNLWCIHQPSTDRPANVFLHLLAQVFPPYTPDEKAKAKNRKMLSYYLPHECLRPINNKRKLFFGSRFIFGWDVERETDFREYFRGAPGVVVGWVLGGEATLYFYCSDSSRTRRAHMSLHI